MEKAINKKEFLELTERSAGIIHKITTIFADFPEDKEDLYQEILYQAWKSYPNFKKDSKFSTWLYRIGMNTALVFKRRSQQGNAESIDESRTIIVHDNQDLNNRKAALLSAIKTLAKVDRMIITLHLEGYNNQEIAEMVGTTKGNTAVKLHRIKEQLKLKLKEE